MCKLLWIVCLGLFCWITISQAEIVITISCRFMGVFHMEVGSRYKQVYEDAKKSCSEVDAIIATKEQVERAHQVGFETCRYGWVENGTVVIPRLTSNHICAAGYVGVFVPNTNLTTPFDVYCYNASDSSEKNCEQYDYQNKSVPSYDPTEEGDIIDSSFSNMSPTDPGHDISSSISEQGGLFEDNTSDPLTSTEQPEHSGDHVEMQEETGDIKRPYLVPGDNEFHNTSDGEGFLRVQPTYDVFDTSEDSEPATPIQQATGSINEVPPDQDRDEEFIERNPDPTDDVIGSPSESTEEPAESTDEFSGSIKNRPRRKPAVPEWLIVCVSLVCLGLIFSVCIALNARRICGQKKKLVINGNKGSPEDGVIMEQNGDTVKSQEMVQLVSRDQTNDLGDGDALTQDDIRNTRDVDMKIGV
ncbi:CD44 antigen isoform X1 [Eleutherodactylus coqui]|uniref:CD44 antigen isoform X1 n=1 Tax=Eleutherodactylus coqui TaxID=57060 RepID=UPI003462FBA8